MFKRSSLSITRILTLAAASLLTASAFAEDGPVTKVVQLAQQKDAGKVVEVAATGSGKFALKAVKGSQVALFSAATDGTCEATGTSALRDEFKAVGKVKPITEVVQALVTGGYTEENIQKISLDGEQWDCIVTRDGAADKVVIDAAKGTILFTEKK